jgi:hypothetical protein
MIALMGQAVVGAAPNVIYVRDAAGGMSEWVKILITAIAGAIFGIVSAPLTELAKSFILRIPMRRKIKAQLGNLCTSLRPASLLNKL